MEVKSLPWYEKIKSDPEWINFQKCENDFFERFGKIFWHDEINSCAWHYDIPDKPFIIAKNINEFDVLGKSSIGHPKINYINSEYDFLL